MIEAAGVDTWFLKLPSGDWEEVGGFIKISMEEIGAEVTFKLKSKPEFGRLALLGNLMCIFMFFTAGNFGSVWT